MTLCTLNIKQILHLASSNPKIILYDFEELIA